jgi:hypothetical protein
MYIFLISLCTLFHYMRRAEHCEDTHSCVKCLSLQKRDNWSRQVGIDSFIGFLCAPAVFLRNKWNIDSFLLTDTSHFVIIFHT